MNTKEEKLAAFGRLLDVMDTLREKCPWDHKQTNESLRSNTIEEVYELSNALLNNDKDEIRKELGDVLLQVVFYAKIAQEKGDFDIADVCNALCDKLIFRHPHVYPPQESVTSTVETADEVISQWEKLKTHEKGGNKTVLSGVPQSLPSLIKAYRIQEKAAGVGFDWDRPIDVWDKVKEEIKEFELEVEGMDKEAAEREMGDVFFSLINAARLYHINPDNALEQTNRKFIRRFTYVEEQLKAIGKSLTEASLEEMERLWQQAKSES
ncbi:MAG: nucleoside triphosphate pyrophosphohydrolase [Alloprevotella sp.]|nr:nucleoside triphosphate pyrophosphohydrolase [Alloprevotella sp.]